MATRAEPVAPDRSRGGARTLVELLQSRAETDPERRALTFLVDGETDARDLTYSELDTRARAVAAHLRESGAGGQPALLLYPPGIDYIVGFLGCLYAGVTAVPAYPPVPNRESALGAIAADAAASVALTTSEIAEAADHLFAGQPALERLRWLATDGVPLEAAADWRGPSVSETSLAFLQYSSGSTGSPKGVMLTHANLLANSAAIVDRVSPSPESCAVIWLPPYHDMGLIGGLIQPLYSGFPVVLMSPLAFLERPIRWLSAISRYRATLSAAPNFAYDLCVRKTKPEERARLDLASWQLALNGAEPVREHTMERFARVFAPCGFRRAAFFPCYGSAEATLLVSGGGKHSRPHVAHVERDALGRGEVSFVGPDDGSPHSIVGCGAPHGNQRVEIVDWTTGTPCSDRRIGEIWVSGPSVAKGYWRRPDETERALHARLGDTSERFLRTGDLGFMHDGELFVTGRLKDLLVLNGRNVYPQDLESTAQDSCDGLRRGCAAAFSVECDHGESAVLVQEINRQQAPALDVAMERLRRSVAEVHGVSLHAIVLIEPGALPKTSSGKVRRGEARRRLLAGELPVAAEWCDGAPLASTPPAGERDAGAGADLDAARERAARERRHRLVALQPGDRRAAVECHLRSELADVLQVDQLRLERDVPLTSLGVDSLKALDVKTRLEEAFAIALPITALGEGASIDALALELVAAIVEADLIDTDRIEPGRLPDVSADLAGMGDEQIDSALDALLNAGS